MKYWWALNKVKKNIKFSIIGLLMCMEIGCSTKQNKASDKFGNNAHLNNYFQENVKSIDEIQEEVIDKKKNEMISHADINMDIDYSLISEEHSILEYDVCDSPRYDYEETPLKEYLEEDIEYDQEMEKAGLTAKLQIEYFIFDFNGDGLDDYLVCMNGFLWGGSGGNTVRMYIQETNGGLRKVLDTILFLHEPGFPNEHAPVAVLNELTGGYYAIAVLEGNRILRYDENTERYEFQED